MAQSSDVILRVGTRGSPLALVQAGAVCRALVSAHGWDEDAVAITIIRTSGDIIQDRPLAQSGGKGLFTKEIEEALIGGTIDLAVHSAKDMPTTLPTGLVLAACLEREDVRDAFISRKASHIRELTARSVVGTASLRRQAMIRRLRPDLLVASLRGNVETRLSKLEAGAVDAIVLAMAGLSRLGLEAVATSILPVDEFLPAVGQGAIAIEARERDERVRSLLAGVDHAATTTALAAERAFLGELEGSCRTPIAGYARLSHGQLQFCGMVLKPDGSEAHETARTGDPESAALLGADAGHELKGRASPDFFAVQ
jgi:hydroxymethylbilane synthase